MGEGRRLPSAWGGVACVVGFALSVMTVSKTLLYGEAFFFPLCWGGGVGGWSECGLTGGC